MKGILGFCIWIAIGGVLGEICNYHGVVDILFWPISVVYRIWQKMNGEDWD